tara:strand:- start:784 stop:1044 length:261 start_codon:yes stop_codon:yes gene_type:complete
MKRQSKLNKYLAGPKVNRRFSAQQKRNAHNREILMGDLLREGQYYAERKRLKLEKLRGLVHENADTIFENVSEEILDAEFEDVKVD